MAEGTSSGAADSSLLRLVNTVLRYRMTIAATAVAFALVVGVLMLLSRRDYTAVATFTPQSRRLPSALSGLASQFGLTLPGSETNQSPAFYASLLESREVLEGVVDSQYTISVDGKEVSGNLVDFFKSGGRTPALQREAAIKRLGEATEVATSLKTGVVQLKVTMRDPELARSVAERFLELLNSFNLKSRQSQASAERQFTERRVTEVRQDLKEAEDREQQFLQRNRDFRNSPELTFTHDRLAREVAMQQQIYTGLMQAYEQAKIEEVRDTPVITVIERPEAPVRADPRGTVRKTVLGLLLGGMIGVFLALWREFVRQADPAGRAEVDEFLQLRADLFGDFRHPLRAVRRAFDGGGPT
jgi:uncharacterized protein involved in exopolysaccharide biosynthesis